jgi:hypothetical protein
LRVPTKCLAPALRRMNQLHRTFSLKNQPLLAARFIEHVWIFLPEAKMSYFFVSFLTF